MFIHYLLAMSMLTTVIHAYSYSSSITKASLTGLEALFNTVAGQLLLGEKPPKMGKERKPPKLLSVGYDVGWKVVYLLRANKAQLL